MADHARFGPAGVPVGFFEVGDSVVDVPAYLHGEGLDAFEYQAVRWGQKPQMKREAAEALGANAGRFDVWMSMHGSYFINLAGETKVLEASKRRLIACVTAADWMQAHIMVFHPGYYGRRTAREALKSCLKALNESVGELKALGLSHVSLGLETSGRRAQLGSLDEVLTLCERVDQAQPVVDWSHLHARERGRFLAKSDFRQIIDGIERRLGAEAARNLHCHFSKIEFSSRGERRHHMLAERKYGPDFRFFAAVIAEMGLKPVVISESPVIDIDAQKMRDMVKEELGKHAKTKLDA